MPIPRLKHWAAGDTLDAVDFENELNNLADNVVAEPLTITQQVDLDGHLLIMDADGNTVIDPSTNDTIGITIAGANDFAFTMNTFTALAGSSIAITQGNLTVTDGQTTLADPDSRTNTVATPLIVAAETSGTPAAGIGTGILFKAESADEAPSSFGQLEVVASDIATGSEDTYWQLLSRVAGAALTAVYRFVAAGAYKAILTHTNTADRTYTLPDRDVTIGSGHVYMGASSIGSGSTRSLETFTSATGNLSGIHFYSGNVTLSSSHTLTVPAGKKRLVIIATGTISIAGTITAAGAGGAAGTATAAGEAGTDQAGGGGDTTNGGPVVAHGCVLTQAIGYTAATQLTGSDCAIINDPTLAMGGSGGGYGGGTTGIGGGSIVLIAPVVTLAATAVLNTSGTSASGNPGGGGGGAGNIYIVTRSYTDSGATFTQTAGAGSGTPGTGGQNGAAGIKQVLVYA